jgi:asparagine synthetase B (glutamine-hydrolysing)
LVTTGINIDPQLYYGPNVGSNAKVVLSGLGADEVWGGYARYKTAFLKEGQAGL